MAKPIPHSAEGGHGPLGLFTKRGCREKFRDAPEKYLRPEHLTSLSPLFIQVRGGAK